MTGSPDDQSDNQAPRAGQSESHGGARLFGRRRSLQTPAEALHPDIAPPPPISPNSERRPILSALSGFLSLSLVGALVALAGISLASRKLSAPGPLRADKVIYVAPRTGVVQIIAQLEKAEVIDQPTLMKTALWVQRKWSKVKAGEYLFKANASHADVIDTLVSGKQVLHSVTLPEGLTSQQIVERLRANDVLAGDIKEIPPEGSILPETYKVARGDSRSRLLSKMKLSQARLLDRIWRGRSKDLPLKTKYELLTLASIIEKETGRADERSRVAAVFYNRLKKRMKLQSDPTIVYGLVGGRGTLGRSILKTEIRKPTPYNTYVIPGLPVGPIANPGRAALEAAANPSRTNDLFFVANGSGAHAFAETYEGHKKNVARWRQIEGERAAAKRSSGAQPANGAVKGAGAPANVDRVVPQLEEEAKPDPRPKRKSKRRRRGAAGDASPFGIVPASFDKRNAAPKFDGLKPRQALAMALAQKFHKHAERPSVVSKPDEKPKTAAKTESNKIPEAGKFAISPGLASIGLKIVGVTPDTTNSPLDGPDPDDLDVNDRSPVASVPMSPANRAELASRVARYAGMQTPVGNTTQAARTPPARVPLASDPSGKTLLANAKRRILDASEGTKLDPLLDKGWDLNSTHTIPKLK